MLSDEQKASREGTIGSSDAPVVCGLSPYKSPLVLYYELHGELPRYTDEETQAQRIGSRLEPVIAKLAAEELKIKIRKCPPRRHPKHAFMSANLDYEIVSHPKGPGVFEIKNRSGIKPWETLPEDIEIQTRHQMAVTNREWGIVAAMFQFGTIKHYELERDMEIEEYLIHLEQNFLVRVQKGEPPDQSWTPQTIGLLKKLYPMDNGVMVSLPEHALTCEAFLKAKAAVEAAETEKAHYEGMLKDAIGSASGAEIPGYKVTWKSTKPTKAFDEAAFKAAHPDLYEQFIKERPGYRRFLLKPIKELVCKTPR